MATQLEEQDDFTEDSPDLSLDDDDDQGASVGNDADDDADGDGESEAGTDDAEEDVVRFGNDDIGSEDEPVSIRNMREEIKRQRARAEAAEARLAPQPETIGEEPNQDDYWDREDPNGDYKRDLLAWADRKRQGEERQRQQQQQADEAKREWEATNRSYDEAGAALRVKDYESAKDAVSTKLSVEQQAMLVYACPDARTAAALTYALGKNPDKLEALLKETNPIKFTAATARLAMEVSVNKRKPTTSPETVHRGAGGSGNSDRRLSALEDEARKTGNRTKLNDYKREKGLA